MKMTTPTLGISPYLVIEGASDAIDFYKRAFGAEEGRRVNAYDKIMYAELNIGGSLIMITDEFPNFGSSGPGTLGGSPVSLHLYVADADQTYAAAIEAGATSIKPVEDQFFGDRHGQVLDPFGYTWTIATRIENISNAVFQERLDALFAQGRS